MMGVSYPKLTTGSPIDSIFIKPAFFVAHASITNLLLNVTVLITHHYTTLDRQTADLINHQKMKVHYLYRKKYKNSTN